jgi:hypothetical protein
VNYRNSLTHYREEQSMTYKTKAQRQRQQWLRLAEEQIVKARPDLASKLHWADLIHCYNTHSTVKSTVKAYLKNYKTK